MGSKACSVPDVQGSAAYAVIRAEDTGSRPTPLQHFQRNVSAEILRSTQGGGNGS